MPKNGNIDLNSLDAKERKRIERILKPRDYRLSLHFNEVSVDAWKAAAKAEGESLTSWIERHLDAVVDPKK